MKKIMSSVLLITASLAIGGCSTIPADVKTQHKEEKKALVAYQKAENKVYRADVAMKKAGVLLVLTTANKKKAQAQLVTAKEKLDEVLNKQ